jgi:putative thioredoxin
LLDQLTLSSAEILKEDLAGLLEAGRYDRALAMLQQAIAEEPQNQVFQVELADVLARSGKLEEARQVVAGIVEGADERDRPQTRIELLEEAAQLEPLEKLEESLARDPDDLQARYGIALHAAVAGDYARALDESLAILRADRGFRDDLGRLTMIRLFKIMGKGSALASQYRRQMFNFMH